MVLNVLLVLLMAVWDGKTFPLPIDTLHSYDTYAKERKALTSRVLAKEIQLNVPTTTGKRAVGSPNDPDYAIFGTVDYSISMDDKNLQPFDRIALEVLPTINGTGIVNLNLQLNNATPAQVGAHLINLIPNKWNHIVYELGELPREHVKSIRIYTDIKGRQPITGTDSVHYTIRNIRIEQTGYQAKERGWEPEDNMVSYSMSGYLTNGHKTAVVNRTHIGKPYSIIDIDKGKAILSGKVASSAGSIGTLGVIDFSALTQQGSYRIEVDSILSEPFPIGNDIFQPSAWRVLNYIFCQRCGCEVRGIHDACHSDLYADYNGRSFSYGGGWHDAGDLSQQTLQTADVAFALLEASERYKHINKDLSERLKEEACWGLKFILQCRLGDGYHASSLGLLHWTDNKSGTFDDIHTVRKQNHAFDNLLYAAYEAFACRVLGEQHPLYPSLFSAAKEDFEYAATQYDEKGILPYDHIMEHTYNTPPSLFTATASWAATQLYILTHETSYAQRAAQYINYTLQCQETKGKKPELKGFFYRDESRRSIVHFIHQSREQLFALALTDLCKSQPYYKEIKRWKAAIKLYAQYLGSLIPYTYPYKMASSGTYLIDEYTDKSGFQSLHIFAPDNAQELYVRQLREGGVQLDNHHYVKRFPVWFNIFNGNEAVILSAGKAAAVLGRFLGDKELLNYAQSQLYWTVGLNPFCQSLIYGEGYRYPSMDSFSSGEITGEMPVGIRSWKNTDEPYWPQTNNACYKEVWLTSAGKWLSLIAEF